MSELGDLLELMHTADRRWRTIGAAGEEWRHLGRARNAFEREISSTGSRGVGYVGSSGGRPEPEEVTESWCLWLAQPDKVRTEFSVDDDAVTVVIVGHTWWSWSPQRGPTTNDGDPRSSHGWGPGAPLIDPFAILPALELEIVGRTAFIGRPVLDVLATRSEIDDNDEEAYYRRAAVRGADQYALMVDAEFGVLLRSEARIDGEPFRITEMHAIAFDEQLEEDVFLPPGNSAIEAASAWIPRWVNLRDLPKAVSFTVLVPEHPPFGASTVAIHPPKDRDGVPEQVHIGYASELYGEEEGQFWLVESAVALLDTRAVAWDTADGMCFGEDHDIEPPLRVIQLERLGTHVEVRSYSIEIKELLDLARSLVPLDSGPPRLK